MLPCENSLNSDGWKGASMADTKRKSDFNFSVKIYRKSQRDIWPRHFMTED